jgi:pimeloyl-ACP methyl ester carboxylesterase
MQESRTNRIGFVTKKQAANIKAPTLILWGKHDVLLPLSDGELLDRVIPNSRLVVLQESGHIPQVEQPDEFNKSLHDFLSAESIDASKSAQR